MKEMTNIIVLAIGKNHALQLQTHFAILSAYKFNKDSFKYIIYTDDKKQYEWISSIATVRELSEETIKTWIGPYNYFYRIKLECLLDSCNKDQGHIVFLDSDTFTTCSLENFVSGLNQRKHFMHLRESLVSKDKSKDKKEMWEKTKNKKINHFLIDENTYIWNSGVIAINVHDKSELLKKSLDLNDEFCKLNIDCRVKEQFAIGVVLQKTEVLLPSNEWIIHYWGNKNEWCIEIEKFLAESLMSKLTPLEASDKINVSLFSQIPINRAQKSMAKKINKFLKKYYQDNLTYWSS